MMSTVYNTQSNPTDEPWARFRDGDSTAREQLIHEYLPLVGAQVNILSKRIYWVNREDLFQEGIQGLIKAIDRFVPGQSSFGAFAKLYIRGEILNSPVIERNVRSSQWGRVKLVHCIAYTLMLQLGRSPALGEIAAEAGLTVKQVEDALRLFQIAFAEEVDLKVASDIPYNPTMDRFLAIEEALSTLSDRNQRIVLEHYWLGLSNREIAESNGMGVETVKKIIQRSLIKLRAYFGDEST